MAFTWQIHKPRQVILVVFLTSVFWFVLNTVILISYQANITSNDAKAVRRLRGENKDDQLQFEQRLEAADKRHKLLPRGISEVGDADLEEELDTINKEILQDNESKDIRNLDTQVIKKELTDETEKSSLKKEQFIRKPRLEKTKKKPKVLKKKQISAIRSFPSEDTKKGAENTKAAVHIPSIPDVKARDPNGPGEDGKPVVFAEGEKKKEKEGYSKYAFNEYASQKISLIRSIPDTRTSG